MEKIRWGIVGCGHIAQRFAQALAKSHHGVLTVVASRDATKAKSFAKEFTNVIGVGSYDELYARNDVDVVYIATPHPFHKECVVAAAQAKKHILCEKPFAMNASEAQGMFDAVAFAGVFCMEAFMYRCHPQTYELIQLVTSGRLGEIRLIQAEFAFARPYDPSHRLFAPELGGGAILDLGCYCTSMARLIAGASVNNAFLEPTVFEGAGVLAEGGVDEYAIASLRFGDSLLANLVCGLRLQMGTLLRVYGSEGMVSVPVPFKPAPLGGEYQYHIQSIHTPEIQETIIKVAPSDVFAIEADAVAAAIYAGAVHLDAMSPLDSLGNMRSLDCWRSACGISVSQS